VVCYFAETGTKPKSRAWVARLVEKIGKKKTPLPAVSMPAPEAAPAPVAEVRPVAAQQPAFFEKY
jgi:hypothetical protein